MKSIIRAILCAFVLLSTQACLFAAKPKVGPKSYRATNKAAQAAAVESNKIFLATTYHSTGKGTFEDFRKLYPFMAKPGLEKLVIMLRLLSIYDSGEDDEKEKINGFLKGQGLTMENIEGPLAAAKKAAEAAAALRIPRPAAGAGAAAAAPRYPQPPVGANDEVSAVDYTDVGSVDNN